MAGWTWGLFVGLPLVAAQCSRTQDLNPSRFPIIELESGAAYNGSLCPGFWAWFRMPTNRNVTYTRLVPGADGIWEPEPVLEAMPHAVSVAVDAGYDSTNFRFTSLEVLVVNGTPPGEFPCANCYNEGEYAGTTHVHAPFTDRETITLGCSSVARAPSSSGPTAR